MDIKTMLKKYFIGYGEKGAGKPSFRGSYEAAVPESLKQRVLSKKQNATRRKVQ